LDQKNDFNGSLTYAIFNYVIILKSTLENKVFFFFLIYAFFIYIFIILIFVVVIIIIICKINKVLHMLKFSQNKQIYSIKNRFSNIKHIRLHF
jgi:type IV secretory pathway component VirB8